MKTLNLFIHQPKLWFIDIDGVVFVHNSYLKGKDDLVSGAKEFIDKLPAEDMIVLVTARAEQYRKKTEKALRVHGIRYEHILFNVPKGERILINDNKPDGTRTAFTIPTKRNEFPNIQIKRN